MSQLVQVKMKTSMAGPNITCGVGQVIAVPREQADELIAGNYAERVGAEPAPPTTESAELDGGETAAVTNKPQGRKRGRRG